MQLSAVGSQSQSAPEALRRCAVGIVSKFDTAKSPPRLDKPSVERQGPVIGLAGFGQAARVMQRVGIEGYLGSSLFRLLWLIRAADPVAGLCHRACKGW